MKKKKKETEHILGSGAKRLRHGTYKIVYLDNHGRNKSGTIRRDWRAEIQTISASGVVRLRGWFKTYEDARRWVDGK